MSTITLPEDIKAWAEAKVAAGQAESLDHAVAKALEAKIAQDAWLDRALQKGLDDLNAGRYADCDDVFTDLIAELDADSSAKTPKAA